VWNKIPHRLNTTSDGLNKIKARADDYNSCRDACFQIVDNGNLNKIVTVIWNLEKESVYKERLEYE
jgi:hypothetical protein